MRSSSSDRTAELTKGGNGGIFRQPLFGSPVVPSLLDCSLGVRRGETRLAGGVVEVGVPNAGKGVVVLARDVMAAAAAVGPKRP